jgi:hypothetical protein
MAGLLSFLTDISIQAGGQPIAGGPLSKLAGGKYGLDNMRYPLDLASSDKNHYIQFTIFTQEKTVYYEPVVGTSTPIDGTLSTQAARNQAAKLGGIIVGAAGNLIEGASGFFAGVVYGPEGKALTKSLANTATTTAVDIVRASGGSLRATQRISTTISLYMPDTVVFDDHQGYSDVQSGGELLTTLAAASGSVVDYVKGRETAGGAVKNLTPFILGALANKGGGFAKTLFSAATGVVVNPMLELIYSSPSFRTFRFDFMFYPRSTKEGEEVQKIIETLRFHQAPEVAQGSNGFFMVPPSEFGIKFYNDGRENPNIPTIAQCVMESLSVDYAPQGFSAYETLSTAGPAKGGKGMPVAIRVSMQFKETEIRTKKSHPRPGREGFTETEVRDFINKLGSSGKIE